VDSLCIEVCFLDRVVLTGSSGELLREDDAEELEDSDEDDMVQVEGDAEGGNYAQPLRRSLLSTSYWRRCILS
jgi:hypothetical protein